MKTLEEIKEFATKCYKEKKSKIFEAF